MSIVLIVLTIFAPFIVMYAASFSNFYFQYFILLHAATIYAMYILLISTQLTLALL